MKLTVIPADGYISVDGVALTFSFAYPANVHAIQWNGSSGTVETKDGSQSSITKLADVQVYLDAFNAESFKRSTIANTPKLLADVKDDKVKQIESARDTATHQDVTAHATQWQADERSQKLLGDALTLAMLGAPLPPVWRDSLNNNMTITAIADLAAIAGAMAVQTQAAYAKSWTLKAQVEAATDVATVNAINW